MAEAADQEKLKNARQRLDRMAWILDDSIALPGTNRRFGLDPLLGLIPGAGDIIGALLSLWLVVEAARLGAPSHLLTRMLGNVLIESIVGIVPLVGDLFDFFWKANSRNRDMLSNYIDHQLVTPTTPNTWLWVGFALIMLLLILFLYPSGLTGL